MDKMHQALERFRNPYSCAQTIWAAYGGGDDRLDEMKANRRAIPRQYVRGTLRRAANPARRETAGNRRKFRKTGGIDKMP